MVMGSGDRLSVQRARALVQIRAPAELDVQQHTFCCEYILTFHTPLNEQVLALGPRCGCSATEQIKGSSGEKPGNRQSLSVGLFVFLRANRVSRPTK